VETDIGYIAARVQRRTARWVLSKHCTGDPLNALGCTRLTNACAVNSSHSAGVGYASRLRDCPWHTTGERYSGCNSRLRAESVALTSCVAGHGITALTPIGALEYL
jgi:hypothetical protein